jgi:hypothetical protein
MCGLRQTPSTDLLSPFPAEPGISPVSQDFTFSPVSVPLSEAAVDTVEPLAHIRQNFEIDNLRLGVLKCAQRLSHLSIKLVA